MADDERISPIRALAIPAILAFATVYIVWGSTYLAIRVAVETIPPFLMAGVRFIFAGSVMFGALRWTGTPMPTRRQWLNAGFAGTLMLVGGNGLVVWAEQTVPSSLAALLVALTPVWFALLEWILPAGKRPVTTTWIGIVVGFGGVALLVTGRNPSGAPGAAYAWGSAALVFAGMFWAVGSMWSRYNARPESPWMNAAVQMISASLGLLVLSTWSGEFSHFHISQVSRHSGLAWIYLVVFGSWIGFSAYVWLLKATTPTLLATYAYVNPVIAVVLGSIVLGEPFGARSLSAAAIILLGVVITTLPGNAR